MYMQRQRRSSKLGMEALASSTRACSAPQYGLDIIAVKVVHEHMKNKVTEQWFMAEVGCGHARRINHANFIRLISFC
jgi:hypothetical protein